MGLWDNIGFKSCPAGQRYSSLLEMCVADDADGAVLDTPNGQVLVNEPATQQQNGRFWDRAPEYIDSLANLWSAIKGRPLQNGQGDYAGQYQAPPKDNTGLLIAIFAVVLLLLFLLFRFRK